MIDVELLKDFADAHGAMHIAVTIQTAPDHWQTTEVRHAGLMDDSPDGWTVEIKEHSL